MNKFVCLAVAAICLPASANAASLYECAAVNRAIMTPDGLEIQPSPDFWVQGMKQIIFDAESGLFRQSPSQIEATQFDVLDSGSVGGGFDAIATWEGGRTVFRIRVWKEGMPFVYYRGADYIAGHCHPWGE